MNPILLITYNNLHYTKMAIDSALTQDIPVQLTVINNGSTDGTRQWLDDLATMVPNVAVHHYPRNESPVKLGNLWARHLFSLGAKQILGLPNDVKIPTNCYSEMLKWPRGFVCATDIGQSDPPPPSPARAVSENTPMAVMMVRSWAFQAIVAKDGYFFDESFFHYCSDCDLALRMAACGIRGVQLDLPYYHFGSASLRLADPFTQSRLLRGADEDRAKFVAKWGFRVDSTEYGQVAADPNWKGVGK